MDVIITKLIEQLNSSVFVLLGILAAAFWSVYRLAKLIEQFSHHKVKIDKVDSLSDRLIELKVKVDLIYQNTNPNRTVAAASPISLTTSGHEIAAKIKADEILAKYLVRLTALVDESKPQTAYDIQVVSMATAKEKMMPLLNADEINTVKAMAYAKGLLAEDVLSIFGVLLRDAILLKKGVTVSEVDK